MNRKKQIQEFAKNIANKSITNKGIAYLQAIEAMEWADRTMIARVCDYLESLTYQEFPGAPMERLVSDDVIDGLFKAMEE